MTESSATWDYAVPTAPPKMNSFWSGQDPSEEEPCEAMFDRLATCNPIRLVGLLESDKLEPHLLTYAAESVGRIRDARLVVPALVRLLGHRSPAVREGAIYGLASFVDRQEVMAALLEHANPDREKSPGVRAAARETLDSTAE